MPNPNERRPARKPDPKAANARRGEKSRSAPRKGPAPARVAALEALMDVQISDAYAGLALTRRIASARLSALDRRLMTELFYGVLENRICLDYILSKYVERPCGDDVTLDILRMGVYQLVFMDKIPENAACNDAVELTRRFRREKMSGLVNAVLRGLVRDRSRIVYPEDPAEFLSVRYSFPRWLVDLLIDEYGMDFAKEMISFRDKQHDVTIRPNLLKMDAPSFEKYLTDQGFDWEKSAAPGVYRVRGGFVSQHPGFRQGLYSIMGESSYLAALAVGVKPGMQVLDACAAPGGKACCMAEQMAGSGRVYAWDLHEHRVKLISGASQRLGLDNVRPRVQDASRPVEDMNERMDAVLVDAPCSGLGVYLSKPDIKYRLRPEEPMELHELQLKILDACARYVKPGGTLVYSTCTLFREENELTVQEFLKKHPSFELKGLAERMPEPFAEKVRDGMLTLYPHRDGTDGFFIARMVRKKRG